MRRDLCVLVAGGFLGFAAVLGPGQSASATPLVSNTPFLVIVNAENSVTIMSRAELADVFLKRLVKWPNGTRIAPVDLPRRSPVREEFSKLVHVRSTAALVAYWQQQIFSGHDTPPPEKPTDADILAFVRENPGGVGYVASQTPLGTGVKVVTVRGL